MQKQKREPKRRWEGSERRAAGLEGNTEPVPAAPGARDGVRGAGRAGMPPASCARGVFPRDRGYKGAARRGKRYGAAR